MATQFQISNTNLHTKSIAAGLCGPVDLEHMDPKHDCIVTKDFYCQTVLPDKQLQAQSVEPELLLGITSTFSTTH